MQFSNGKHEHEELGGRREARCPPLAGAEAREEAHGLGGGCGRGLWFGRPMTG